MISKRLPKISIGMPVFNGDLFISEALDSLLAQTFNDFELIISDNCSTDATESICRKYAAKDQRIRYLRQVKNRGASFNFKLVLDEAAGEYFMWAAADDVWDPRWIETLLRESIATQSVVFGNLQQIDAERNIIHSIANNRNLSFCGRRIIRRAFFFLEPGIFGKANLIYGIYPRKILTPENVSVLGGGYIHTDMLFIYNLLKLVNFYVNCEVNLYKRIHHQYDRPNELLEKNNINRLNFYKLKNFMKYYDGYFWLSNSYEKVVIITLMPSALLYDVLIRLYKKIY